MKRSFQGVLLAGGLFGLLGGVAQADSLQLVARRLVKGLDHSPSKRIAVLSFSYPNGEVSSASSLVSERLTTLIVQNGGAKVVERALLDKALGEIRLGMSGVLDPSESQKLGKILGVEAIVTGTLNDVGEQETEVNARLIQTETGAVLAAATARITRGWLDVPHTPLVREAGRSPEDRPSADSSDMIPTPDPRHSAVAAAPAEPAAPLPAAAESGDGVLTLRNEDLVPIQNRGQTDPERILNDFLSDRTPPPNNGVSMARRIYHRNPSPHIRAQALLAMGHLWERSGQPENAAQAYRKIIDEFPNEPDLQAQARRQLAHVTKPAPAK